MLFKFSRPNGDPVYINPELVRQVSPHAQDPERLTILHFDKDHYIAVTGEIAAIARRFDN